MGQADAFVWIAAALTFLVFWAVGLADMLRWRRGEPPQAFMVVRWRLGRVFMWSWLALAALCIPAFSWQGIARL